MATNLKKILNKTTYDIIETYVNNGKDAISLLGYKNKGVNFNDVVNSFHALANPKYLAHITYDFGNEFYNTPYKINKNIAPYFEDGFNAFALKTRDFQTTKLKFPLVNDFNVIDKTFLHNTKLENYDEILNLFEQKFNAKFLQKGTSANITKEKFNFMNLFLQKGVGIVKAFGRKIGKLIRPAKFNKINFNKLISKPKSLFTTKINLANNNYVKNGFKPVNMPISEINKVVAIVDFFSKKTLSKLNTQYPDKTLFNYTSNSKKFMFASQILTDIFVCQALDLGENNEKVDHALKLQLSNLLSTFDEEESKFISVISKNAERATKIMLKILDLKPTNIIENRKKMGIIYKNQPQTPYDLLFGETQNLQLEKNQEQNLIYQDHAEIFKDFEEPETTTQPAPAQTQTNTQPDEDFFEETPINTNQQKTIPDEELFEETPVNTNQQNTIPDEELFEEVPVNTNQTNTVTTSDENLFEETNSNTNKTVTTSDENLFEETPIEIPVNKAEVEEEQTSTKTATQSTLNNFGVETSQVPQTTAKTIHKSEIQTTLSDFNDKNTEIQTTLSDFDDKKQDIQTSIFDFNDKKPETQTTLANFENKTISHKANNFRRYNKKSNFSNNFKRARTTTNRAILSEKPASKTVVVSQPTIIKKPENIKRLSTTVCPRLSAYKTPKNASLVEVKNTTALKFGKPTEKNNSELKRIINKKLLQIKASQPTPKNAVVNTANIAKTSKQETSKTPLLKENKLLQLEAPKSEENNKLAVVSTNNKLVAIQKQEEEKTPLLSGNKPLLLKEYNSDENIKPVIVKNNKLAKINNPFKKTPTQILQNETNALDDINSYLRIEVEDLENQKEVVFNKSYITRKQVEKAFNAICVKAINELHASTIKNTLVKDTKSYNSKIKMIEFWQTSLTGTKYTEKQQENYQDAIFYLEKLENLKNRAIKEIFKGETKIDKEKLGVSSAQSLINKYFREKTNSKQYIKTIIKKDMKQYADEIYSEAKTTEKNQ